MSGMSGPTGSGIAQQEGLPHDIRGLLPYVPWGTYLLWFLLGAAALAGLLYLWKVLKRRRKERPVAPVDPWDDLKGRLGRLRPQLPFGRKEQEDFFFQLSLMLREAIELRTRIRATDLTSDELKEPLRRRLPLPPAGIQAVLAFLERADLVKFAEAPSDRGEAEEALGQVGAWVRELTPKSIDAAPAGDGASGGEESHAAG
jgi:hypothetical protein